MALESFPRPLSYDDYAAIDDGQRYQVIEGVLFLMTSPSRRHQRVLLRLAQQLANFLDAHPIGEVYMAPFDVVLRAEAPANVFQPDLLVILQDQASILTRANVQGAPALVVEVLSPSTAVLDMTKKLQLYARHGVREVWIVPQDDDRVDTFTLGEDGQYGLPRSHATAQALETPLLPGFHLPVSRIFAPGALEA